MSHRFLILVILCVFTFGRTQLSAGDNSTGGTEFFERRIRPILVEHCYECHSEEAQERQGGLLLDRKSAWLEGGETGKAVVPGDAESSLLIAAVRPDHDDLQMPPDEPLSADEVQLLENWVRRGAPAPDDDREQSEFSRLGDQQYLFAAAADHWAFREVQVTDPPASSDSRWNRNPIDRFVFEQLSQHDMQPSQPADSRTLVRRLYYDLLGLPPTIDDVQRFVAAAAKDRDSAVRDEVDRLLMSPHYGQHIGRMWLDVARYADTDSAYRPDTKTPHYFPFAFTYRDYVVDAFNSDKPLDAFLKEQLAADLMGFDADAPEMAALGFFAVGPYANRSQAEALDDWIDLTTRGLMGVTAACARCHDHKFEPVPTADYYSLRGVFAGITRLNPLDEKRQPLLSNYHVDRTDALDYEKQRAKIEAKIDASAGKKAKNNNRSISQKIRETELAELLLRHPGAPARAMIVLEKANVPASYIHLRGDASVRGVEVPRRFLKILDDGQTPFSDSGSGRLQLAEKITDPRNPLTARVFVNRVWGHLTGSHLVATPSDFGLQGTPPTHPKLLDWLADDFVSHGWSVKRLVRTILQTQTYQQASRHRDDMAAIDPENRLLWRAGRRHLSIEAIRDSMLVISGQLDRQLGGRAGSLWQQDYTHRRAVYGYINRFNLDPTLRAFDFPNPMQTQPGRGESIVAPQALFTMNSPLVIDQAAAIAASATLAACETDRQRIVAMFQLVFQREPAENEVERVLKFIELQKRFKPSTKFIDSPWPLIAQSLLMSNEFQYVD